MADNTSLLIEVGANTSRMERDILAAGKRVEGSFKFNLDTRNFSNGLGSINGKVDEFSRSMKSAEARVLAFGIAAGSVFLVSRAMKELVTASIETEKALANINSVLGAGQDDLRKFGDSLFDIAKKTGQSFDEVAKAALEFSRQGLSIQETLRRTSDALILTRLTGLSAAEAVSSLTAIVNSFAKESITTSEAVNRMANVSANFAVKTEDLAEGLKRVGSTAQDAGVSFNQLVAMITVAQSTTQRGGAIIGQALATIFTKLERPKVIDQLRDLGIEGNSTIQILQSLAKNYEQMGSAQRAQVSEIVGGVRQINVLKATLADLGKEYSVYSQALNLANNATDEAVKRNENLNKTLAAQANETLQTMTQVAAKMGQLTLGPAIKNILGGANVIFGQFNKELSGGADGGDIGQRLGQGILKGIGSALAGPGLATIGVLLARTLGNQAGFAASAGKSLLFGTGEKEKVVQEEIKAILSSESSIRDKILSGTLSQLEREKLVTNEIQRRVYLQERNAALITGLASAVVKGGDVKVSAGTIKSTAEGYLPAIAQERNAVRHGVGGANSLARVVAIPNFSIGGRRQTIVANTDEYITPTHSINPNYNGPDQYSILNPQMVQRLGGVPKGSRRIAAEGFVPNFASGYDKAIKIMKMSLGNSVEFTKNRKEDSGYLRGSYWQKPIINIGRQAGFDDGFLTLHELGHAVTLEKDQEGKRLANYLGVGRDKNVLKALSDGRTTASVGDLIAESAANRAAHLALVESGADQKTLSKFKKTANIQFEGYRLTEMYDRMHNRMGSEIGYSDVESAVKRNRGEHSTVVSQNEDHLIALSKLRELDPAVFDAQMARPEFKAMKALKPFASGFVPNFSTLRKSGGTINRVWGDWAERGDKKYERRLSHALKIGKILDKNKMPWSIENDMGDSMHNARLDMELRWGDDLGKFLTSHPQEQNRPSGLNEFFKLVDKSQGRVDEVWKLSHNNEYASGFVPNYSIEGRRNLSSLLKQAKRSDIWDNSSKWYKNAKAFSKLVGEQYGVSQESVAGVVSSLSPRNDWEKNKEDSISTFEALKRGLTQNQIKVSTMHPNKRMAFEIAGGADPFSTLTGEKRQSFFANILGDLNKVTVDIHAHRAWSGATTAENLPQAEGKLYAEIERDYQIVAKRFGIAPAEAQAIIWTQQKANVESGKKSSQQEFGIKASSRKSETVKANLEKLYAKSQQRIDKNLKIQQDAFAESQNGQGAFFSSGFAPNKKWGSTYQRDEYANLLKDFRSSRHSKELVELKSWSDINNIESWEVANKFTSFLESKGEPFGFDTQWNGSLHAPSHYPTWRIDREQPNRAPKRSMESFRNDALKQQIEFWKMSRKNAANGFIPNYSVLSKRALREMAIQTLTKEGSTFNRFEGDMGGRDAYAVSAFPDLTKKLDKSQVTPSALKKIFSSGIRPQLLKDYAAHSAGTWLDKKTGKVFVDIASTLQNRHDAESLGQQANQKAVFDLKRFEEISTGGTGDPINLPDAITRVRTMIGEANRKRRGLWGPTREDSKKQAKYLSKYASSRDLTVNELVQNSELASAAMSEYRAKNPEQGRLAVAEGFVPNFRDIAEVMQKGRRLGGGAFGEFFLGQDERLQSRFGDIGFKKMHKAGSWKGSLAHEYASHKLAEEMGLPTVKVYGSMGRSIDRGGIVKEAMAADLDQASKQEPSLNRLVEVVSDTMYKMYQNAGMFVGDLGAYNIGITNAGITRAKELTAQFPNGERDPRFYGTPEEKMIADMLIKEGHIKAIDLGVLKPKTLEVAKGLKNKLGGVRSPFFNNEHRLFRQAADGFVPNFSALKDAIDRESRFVPRSQIYVDHDPRLKSPANPLGELVANRQDEPYGGRQGVERVIREGGDPRKAGAFANGFIGYVSHDGAVTAEKLAEKKYLKTTHGTSNLGHQQGNPWRYINGEAFWNQTPNADERMAVENYLANQGNHKVYEHKDYHSISAFGDGFVPNFADSGPSNSYQVKSKMFENPSVWKTGIVQSEVDEFRKTLTGTSESFRSISTKIKSLEKAYGLNEDGVKSLTKSLVGTQVRRNADNPPLKTSLDIATSRATTIGNKEAEAVAKAKAIEDAERAKVAEEAARIRAIEAPKRMERERIAQEQAKKHAQMQAWEDAERRDKEKKEQNQKEDREFDKYIEKNLGSDYAQAISQKRNSLNKAKTLERAEKDIADRKLPTRTQIKAVRDALSNEARARQAEEAKVALAPSNFVSGIFSRIDKDSLKEKVERSADLSGLDEKGRENLHASTLAGAKEVRRATLQNKAFNTSFMLPAITETAISLINPRTPGGERAGRAFSGIAQAGGAGLSLLALGVGGPAAPFIAAGVAIVGASKAIVSNLTPSLEDLAKKAQEVSFKNEQLVQSSAGFVTALSNLDEIIKGGGSRAQVRGASINVDTALSQITDGETKAALLSAKTMSDKMAIISEMSQKATFANTSSEFGLAATDLGDKTAFLGMGLRNHLPDWAAKNATSEQREKITNAALRTSALTGDSVTVDKIKDFEKQVESVDTSAGNARDKLADLAVEMGMDSKAVEEFKKNILPEDMKIVLSNFLSGREINPLVIQGIEVQKRYAASVRDTNKIIDAFTSRAILRGEIKNKDTENNISLGISRFKNETSLNSESLSSIGGIDLSSQAQQMENSLRRITEENSVRVGTKENIKNVIEEIGSKLILKEGPTKDAYIKIAQDAIESKNPLQDLEKILNLGREKGGSEAGEAVKKGVELQEKINKTLIDIQKSSEHQSKLIEQQTEFAKKAAIQERSSKFLGGENILTQRPSFERAAAQSAVEFSEFNKLRPKYLERMAGEREQVRKLGTPSDLINFDLGRENVITEANTSRSAGIIERRKAGLAITAEDVAQNPSLKGIKDSQDKAELPIIQAALQGNFNSTLRGAALGDTASFRNDRFIENSQRSTGLYAYGEHTPGEGGTGFMTKIENFINKNDYQGALNTATGIQGRLPTIEGQQIGGLIEKLRAYVNSSDVSKAASALGANKIIKPDTLLEDIKANTGETVRAIREANTANSGMRGSITALLASLGSGSDFQTNIKGIPTSLENFGKALELAAEIQGKSGEAVTLSQKGGLIDADIAFNNAKLAKSKGLRADFGNDRVRTQESVGKVDEINGRFIPIYSDAIHNILESSNTPLTGSNLSKELRSIKGYNFSGVESSILKGLSEEDKEKYSVGGKKQTLDSNKFNQHVIEKAGLSGVINEGVVTERLKELGKKLGDLSKEVKGTVDVIENQTRRLFDLTHPGDKKTQDEQWAAEHPVSFINEALEDRKQQEIADNNFRGRFSNFASGLSNAMLVEKNAVPSETPYLTMIDGKPSVVNTGEGIVSMKGDIVVPKGKTLNQFIGENIKNNASGIISLFPTGKGGLTGRVTLGMEPDFRATNRILGDILAAIKAANKVGGNNGVVGESNKPKEDRPKTFKDKVEERENNEKRDKLNKESSDAFAKEKADEARAMQKINIDKHLDKNTGIDQTHLEALVEDDKNKAEEKAKFNASPEGKKAAIKAAADANPYNQRAIGLANIARINGLYGEGTSSVLTPAQKGALGIIDTRKPEDIYKSRVSTGQINIPSEKDFLLRASSIVSGSKDGEYSSKNNPSGFDISKAEEEAKKQFKNEELNKIKEEQDLERDNNLRRILHQDVVAPATQPNTITQKVLEAQANAAPTQAKKPLTKEERDAEWVARGKKRHDAKSKEELQAIAQEQLGGEGAMFDLSGFTIDQSQAILDSQDVFRAKYPEQFKTYKGFRAGTPEELKRMKTVVKGEFGGEAGKEGQAWFDPDTNQTVWNTNERVDVPGLGPMTSDMGYVNKLGIPRYDNDPDVAKRREAAADRLGEVGIHEARHKVSHDVGYSDVPFSSNYSYQNLNERQSEAEAKDYRENRLRYKTEAPEAVKSNDSSVDKLQVAIAALIDASKQAVEIKGDVLKRIEVEVSAAQGETTPGGLKITQEEFDQIVNDLKAMIKGNVPPPRANSAPPTGEE